MGEKSLQPARIRWIGDVPVSESHDDVYFSKEDGVAETRHVFIEGNRLPLRFAMLKEGSSLSVGELGFGTGQNFFILLEEFLKTAPPRTRLNFHSCELHPLSHEDLSRVIAFRGETNLSREFLASYGRFAPGRQRFLFAEGRVVLDLFLGDVSAFLTGLSGGMDAWFLDGFAPAKNPDMWTEEIFHQIAAKSNPGASASTFSAAGAVKRGLEGAGFIVEKVPGFGRKREMIRADLPEAPSQKKESGSDSTDVIVIGGGVAGLASAFAFARRGKKVRLYEKEDGIARAASGNPAGVVFPFLNAEPTFMSRYLLQGFFYTKHLLEHLQSLHIPVLKKETGVIQLAHEPRQAKRFENALKNLGYDRSIVRPVDSSQVREISGFRSDYSGVFFESGLWLRPPDLVRGLAALAGSNLDIFLNTGVGEIRRSDSGDWEILSMEGKVLDRARKLVVSAAFESLLFSDLRWLPIRRNRGQIALAKETDVSRNLNAVVCFDGYVIPSVEGVHVVGADYERSHFDLSPDPKVNEQLLLNLRTYLPDLFPENPELEGGRTGIRAMGMDHLPLVGPVPDSAGNISEGHFPLLPGLYVSAGHGSRGLSYAPLAGEIIAAMDEGEPLPVNSDLLAALLPERFLLRELKRKDSPGVRALPGMENGKC